MNKVLLILLVAQVSFSKTYSISIEPFYDELEGRNLIEALIKDQKIPEAQDQILKLSDSDPFKLKAQAQVYLLQKQPELVLKLLKNQNLSDVLKIELARAHFELQKFSVCSDIIETIKAELLSLHPSAFYSCFFKNKKWDLAFKLAASCEDLEHLQLQWNWMMSFQLYSSAKLKLISWTENSQLDDELVLKFLSELPKIERVLSLEMIKAIRPISVPILAEWSESEFKSDRPISAAGGFQKVSAMNSDYLFAASELLRSLGSFQQARFLSQMNSDVENQLRSKISIAIDQNAYSQISGLSGPFERSKLIEDQDIVYAFVYSLSPVRPEKAKRISSFIRRADLKTKVNQVLIQNF